MACRPLYGTTEEHILKQIWKRVEKEKMLVIPWMYYLSGIEPVEEFLKQTEDDSLTKLVLKFDKVYKPHRNVVNNIPAPPPKTAGIAYPTVGTEDYWDHITAIGLSVLADWRETTRWIKKNAKGAMKYTEFKDAEKAYQNLTRSINATVEHKNDISLLRRSAKKTSQWITVYLDKRTKLRKRIGATKNNMRLSLPHLLPSTNYICNEDEIPEKVHMWKERTDDEWVNKRVLCMFIDNGVERVRIVIRDIVDLADSAGIGDLAVTEPIDSVLHAGARVSKPFKVGDKFGEYEVRIVEGEFIGVAQKKKPAESSETSDGNETSKTAVRVDVASGTPAVGNADVRDTRAMRDNADGSAEYTAQREMWNNYGGRMLATLENLKKNYDGVMDVQNIMTAVQMNVTNVVNDMGRTLPGKVGEQLRSEIAKRDAHQEVAAAKLVQIEEKLVTLRDEVKTPSANAEIVGLLKELHVTLSKKEEENSKDAEAVAGSIGNLANSVKSTLRSLKAINANQQQQIKEKDTQLSELTKQLRDQNDLYNSTKRLLDSRTITEGDILRELDKTHEANINKLRERHQIELVKLRKDGDKAHEENIAKLRESHKNELVKLLKDRDKAHEENIAKLKERHQNEVDKLHKNEDKLRRSQYLNDISKLKEEHSRAIRELQRVHKSALAEAKKTGTNAYVKSLRGDLTKLKLEISRLHEENTKLKQDNEQLLKRYAENQMMSHANLKQYADHFDARFGALVEQYPEIPESVLDSRFMGSANERLKELVFLEKVKRELLENSGLRFNINSMSEEELAVFYTKIIEDPYTVDVTQRIEKAMQYAMTASINSGFAGTIQSVKSTVADIFSELSRHVNIIIQIMTLIVVATVMINELVQVNSIKEMPVLFEAASNAMGSGPNVITPTALNSSDGGLAAETVHAVYSNATATVNATIASVLANSSNRRLAVETVYAVYSNAIATSVGGLALYSGKFSVYEMGVSLGEVRRAFNEQVASSRKAALAELEDTGSYMYKTTDTLFSILMVLFARMNVIAPPGKVMNVAAGGRTLIV